MKKMLLTTTAALLVAGSAMAEDVKIGVSLAFTGPLESMAPHMAAGAELAMREVTESGKLLGESPSFRFAATPPASTPPPPPPLPSV